MIKLSSREKDFLKEHENDIKTNNYKNIIEGMLTDDYIPKDKMVNLFKELGINLINYSGINVGDAARIHNDTELYIFYKDFFKEFNLPDYWIDSYDSNYFFVDDTVSVLFKGFWGDDFVYVIEKKDNTNTPHIAVIGYFGLKKV